MERRTERRRIDPEERAPAGQEWEVFVREDETDPLRHVGSVRATDQDGAYAIATRLFAWFASDLWICPAKSVTRYSVRDVAEDAATIDLDTEKPEPRSSEWT